MITDKQMQQLEQAINKNQLEAAIYGFVKKFYLKHLWDIEKIFPGNQKAKFAVERLKEKKQLNKTDLYSVCFSVFENEEIYTHFLNSLPPDIQKLIEILLWRDSISHAAAEKELKIKLLDEEKKGYYEPDLKREFYFFAVTSSSEWTIKGSRKNYTLSIPKPLRDILADYYPKPVYYYFVPVDNVPDNYTVFNGEKQILLEMPTILSYHLQALVKYTNSGKPNEPSVNKMQRSCNLTEFFQDELLKNIRSTMIAGMLHELKVKDINTDNMELLKILFTAHYKTIYTPQFILSQFKGWAYINDYYLTDTSFAAMLDTVKQLPQDKWISAQNLHGYILSRTIDIKGVEGWVVNNYLKINETFTSASRSTSATNISIEPLVKIPYINGSVFLLAAFGLLEIMYTGINTNKFGETYYSPYDGLKFLRLTPLGAYILGLTKSYEPQHTSPKNKLHFSEDSLTILAEGDLSVIDIMLARFTEKEGNGRYRVTSAVFFKDCKDLAGIDAKINLFKKTISVRLPRYWDAAFAEWKANAKKVTEKITTHVFEIPSGEKELQNLLAKDGVLKNIILKAEGFNILVERGNIPKFKQRLKEFGYFVEDPQMQLVQTK